MKKLLILLAVVGVSFACGNQKGDKEQVTVVETAEFINVAPELVGELVSIDGTVSHVCKHGGKKMFVGDERIKIVVSEKIAAFDPVLTGSDVTVQGYVREEVVEPVLQEKEHKEGEAKEEEKVEEEQTEETGNDNSADQEEKEEGNPEDCAFEEVVPIYIIEVTEVIEKEVTEEETEK